MKVVGLLGVLVSRVSGCESWIVPVEASALDSASSAIPGYQSCLLREDTGLSVRGLWKRLNTLPWRYTPVGDGVLIVSWERRGLRSINADGRSSNAKGCEGKN